LREKKRPESAFKGRNILWAFGAVSTDSAENRNRSWHPNGAITSTSFFSVVFIFALPYFASTVPGHNTILCSSTFDRKVVAEELLPRSLITHFEPTVTYTTFKEPDITLTTTSFDSFFPSASP